MSFLLENIGGYGAGELGNATLNASSGSANSYARIISSNDYTVTINSKTSGHYSDFTVGTDVLLHVSGIIDTKYNSSYNKQYLGQWIISTITAINGSVLTLDKRLRYTLFNDASDAIFANCVFCQIISIPKFNTLVVDETYPVKKFDEDTGTGGIFVAKALQMSGTLNLLDCGRTPLEGETDNRRLLKDYETLVETDKFYGHEVWRLTSMCPLNVGDGAAFVFAEINELDFSGVTDGTAEGGITAVCVGDVSDHGKYTRNQFRSAKTRPKTRPGVGVGSIYQAWAARNYDSVDTSAQSKRYFTTGNIDVISGTFDISTNTNICDYGRGTLGVVTIPSASTAGYAYYDFNSYANVTNVGYNTVNFEIINNTGVCKIEKGSKVLLWRGKLNEYDGWDGAFIMARILDISGDTMLLDKNIYASGFAANRGQFLQIISVPEFHYLQLQSMVIPNYNSAQSGGIGQHLPTVISANEIYFKSGSGLISHANGRKNYGFNSIDGYHYQAMRLLRGCGLNSIFIMARRIWFEDNTVRLGGYWSGAANEFDYFGGQVTLSSSYTRTSSGYTGAHYYDSISGDKAGGCGGYGGGGNRDNGGTWNIFSDTNNCCWRNGDADANGLCNNQGANLLIIADAIEGLHLSSLSTGGQGDINAYTYNSSKNTCIPNAPSASAYMNGSAGYGGAYCPKTSDKTYYPGGSSGTCFIYCNHCENILP